MQLEFNLIDKYPSPEVPDPPACVIKVYAEDSPNTEDIFHYPVLLNGVKKPKKMFIHLSLRSNLAAGIYMTTCKIIGMIQLGSVVIYGYMNIIKFVYEKEITCPAMS